ncbi:MAG: lipoyl(octanoyl) transferase LipB [Cyclobacteriaceae bacterium]
MISSPLRNTKFTDLGLIDYQQAWDYQENIFKTTVSHKIANRRRPDDEQLPVQNHLIFCSHPHVYTLGKSGDAGNLLLKEEILKKQGIDYYKINRGGDITYHGPGQIVGYPILDLDQFFTDIHKYLRFLEEAVIRTLNDYGLQAGRIQGLTGVWLDEKSNDARKICALGVKTSRWVTMHGFAFNVNTDLKYYDNIVPCGIRDKSVTSLQKELGLNVDMNEVKQKLKSHLAEIFEMTLND